MNEPLMTGGQNPDFLSELDFESEEEEAEENDKSNDNEIEDNGDTINQSQKKFEL